MAEASAAPIAAEADVQHADVIVVGGGLVGASLAVALSRRGRRILLIEAAEPPATAPAWDERTIALNLASERILRDLGVWEPIQAQAAPITATHVGEQGRFGVARFDARALDVPALGYNVPIRVIGETLMQAAQKAAGVELLCPARLQQVTQAAGQVTAVVTHGAHRSCWQARLLVAADGAQSAVRKQLGITAEIHDYHQHAVLSTVRPQRPHRGVAYERFTAQGPIAVLPRASGHCAVVWTVPSDVAERLLKLSDDAFLEALQAAFGRRLGRFSELGRRAAYPLQQVVSECLRQGRIVLAGNAAQTLHPVAAQGFNLGLRDVASLAELLEQAEDPGADSVLEAYVRRRTPDRQQVADFTDHLVRLFSNRLPGLRQLRHWGILGLDLIPALKRPVMEQNLGLRAVGHWQHSGTAPWPQQQP